MKKFFDSVKNICKASAKDQSLMLILTSAAGWLLSSAAQVAAIICNDKIPQKEKNFLVPQEICDGVTNVATFLGITLLTKNLFAKLIQNNKIILKDPKQYASPFLTVVSIVAGAFASNIVTPVIRNYLGANVQKKCSVQNEKKVDFQRQQISKIDFNKSPFSYYKDKKANLTQFRPNVSNGIKI